MFLKLRHLVLASSAVGLVALGWQGPRVLGESGNGRTPRDDERAELARRADAMEPFAHAFRRVAAFARPTVVFVEAKHAFGTTDFGAKLPEDALPGEAMRRFFMSPFRFEGEGAATRLVTSGSGVIVDASGIVFTNAHVIASRAQAGLEVPDVRVELDDGRWFAAVVIGCEPRADLAVLRILACPDDLKAAVLGDSDRVERGDWVLAVGNPFGREQTAAVGVISTRGRAGLGFSDFLETDAAINPGNSGGPLLDLRGETVGINLGAPFTTGGSIGVGFAIPSNTAALLRRQIEEIAGIARSSLGVSIRTLLPSELGGRHGVLVADVSSNSAAARAEIHTGDALLELDGKTIDRAEQLGAFASGSKTVRLAVWCDGRVKSVEVALGAAAVPKDR